jgi:hypothetical protein
MRGFLRDTGGWIGKVSLPNYVTDVTSKRIFVCRRLAGRAEWGREGNIHWFHIGLER